MNDDTFRFIVSPSAISHTIAVIDDRTKTAWTAAASLLCFALVAFVAAVVGHGIAPRFAGTSALLAAVGSLGALVATRVLAWQRIDLYDDIVLTGYRHVGGERMARHAEELVAPERRRQLGDALEQFLDVALVSQLASVPLDRASLRVLAPHVRGLVARLRALNVPVEPAGMVLVRRLVTDGAGSPLFHLGNDGPSELEHAIELIHAQLGTMPVIQLRPAATTEPLRLAA